MRKDLDAHAAHAQGGAADGALTVLRRLHATTFCCGGLQVVYL